MRSGTDSRMTFLIHDVLEPKHVKHLARLCSVPVVVSLAVSEPNESKKNIIIDYSIIKILITKIKLRNFVKK